MTEELSGVQKKVVQSLRQPTVLGVKRGSNPEKSNKELKQELGESVSNINYATGKLKEKDIIKDTTSPLENTKTNFKLKEDVTVEKSYDFDTVIDHTAIIHLISFLSMFLYIIIFAEPVYSTNGIFITTFIAGMLSFLPSFTYNIYNVWSSLDSYNLHIHRDN